MEIALFALMRRSPLANLRAALRARSSSLRIAAISTWSLLLWGGWALVANLGHGLAVAGRAAATQGLVSLSVTFMMTVLLEATSRRCRGRWSRILAPAAVAEAFHAIYTVGLHVSLETPELALTTLPLIAAGLAYSLTYAAAIARGEGRGQGITHAEAAAGRRILQPASASGSAAALSSPAGIWS